LPIQSRWRHDRFGGAALSLFQASRLVMIDAEVSQ
jgi:hypothetical protein